MCPVRMREKLILGRGRAGSKTLGKEWAWCCEERKEGLVDKSQNMYGSVNHKDLEDFKQWRDLIYASKSLLRLLCASLEAGIPGKKLLQ